MDIQVRNATSADVGPLIELSCRTISANYRQFLRDDAVDAFIDTGAVDQFVQASIGHCWVIVVGGRIAGYSVVEGNLIDVLMIDHELNRRGLGTRLLEHMEDMLFRDHDELILESFAGNQKANGFYRKNGWLEARKFLDPESGADKVVFRKSF